eukprot:maker-scaffold119_size336447-snap-gene-1.12 protein:Tk11777 transcript:maker-scaffold119_size336447-snap-gene-1.12-mRNA-1 annotation:"pupal cuticle protein 20 precursor"
MKPARAAANDYAAAEASAPVAFEPVDDAVVQEVRFIEVAQPEYTRANNNAQATYLDSQPIIEVVREAEPARYNRGPEPPTHESGVRFPRQRTIKAVNIWDLNIIRSPPPSSKPPLPTMIKIVSLTLSACLATMTSSARLPRQVEPYANPGTFRTGFTAPAQPIAILSSNYNTPTADSPNFDYAFATENGIQQQVEGQLKRIDNDDVMVMKGSYSYTDVDGREVVVSWYADETGYHPESDILPVAPAIPFPEQAEAVAAQIRFAALEDQNEPGRTRKSEYYQDNLPQARLNPVPVVETFVGQPQRFNGFTRNYQG